mgnify:CR=1 FL=1
MIKSQKDFLNNKTQVQNKDLYNTQKKINSDSKHPFLSYNLEDEFYNQPSNTRKRYSFFTTTIRNKLS